MKNEPFESHLVESHLNEDQLHLWRSLDTPFKIQAFLDTCAYRPEYSNLSPLSVIEQGRAHCLDGAVFGAAALRRLGHEPLLVDMFPDPGMDDDHVLAVYRQHRRWGAVAKSNFVGLRSREPVYRDLHELVMSYFEQFYNINGVKSLRTYTRPLNITKLDAFGWEWRDDGVDRIEKALLKRARRPLLTPAMTASLSPVDSLTYQAGMLVANLDGVYKPHE
jgi:hypothetical protein